MLFAAVVIGALRAKSRPLLDGCLNQGNKWKLMEVVFYCKNGRKDEVVPLYLKIKY